MPHPGPHTPPVLKRRNEPTLMPGEPLLGRSGLLSLPYAEEHGGGGQPYEVYLQIVEEIASA